MLSPELAGRCLSDLVLGKEPSYPIGPLSLSRPSVGLQHVQPPCTGDVPCSVSEGVEVVGVSAAQVSTAPAAGVASIALLDEGVTGAPTSSSSAAVGGAASSSHSSPANPQHSERMRVVARAQNTDTA